MIENKKIFYIKNKLRCVYYYEKRAHILGAPVVRLLGKTSAKGENRRCFANEFFTCFCAKEMIISQKRANKMPIMQKSRSFVVVEARVRITFCTHIIGAERKYVALSFFVAERLHLFGVCKLLHGIGHAFALSVQLAKFHVYCFLRGGYV